MSGLALSVFQAVLNACTKMDVRCRRADCMSRIGDIFMCRGELDGAKEMWAAARLRFARSSRGQDVASIDAKLAQLAPGGVEVHLEDTKDRRASEMDREAVVSPRVESDNATAEELANRLLSLQAPTSQPRLNSSETENENVYDAYTCWDSAAIDALGEAFIRRKL
ncbi:hypothetical protein FB451DRAFT_1180019 [Mycena latifolia]|nr:hypothetical protein FB451DRAFT_1180019 [Mycena latifolia]